MSVKRALQSLLCLVAFPLVPLYFLAAIIRRWTSGRRTEHAEAVLCYSQVIWDDVWQRPQEHAWRTSAERYVIYCAPVQLHNWFWNLKGRYQQVAIHERPSGTLVVLSPLVFSGHFKSSLIHHVNCRLIAWHIRMWLNREAIYCLANTPLALKPIQYIFDGDTRTRLRRTVYDVIDDFPAFRWFPRFAASYHHQLITMSDAVLTGTHQLAKSHGGATFVPCGVDFTAFATPTPPPHDIAELKRPIVGYFGTISERIDLDLVSELCDALPSASIVLIGPVHFEENHLPQHPNLHYLGLKPHHQIPAYAQAFNVGLIPFRLTPATMQLHPVKTLEYLAAGVPVVSTALPEIKHFYKGIVGIAESHGEYIQMVRDRISTRDTSNILAGIERARNASWDAMTTKINELLFAAEEDTSASISAINHPADSAAAEAV